MKNISHALTRLLPRIALACALALPTFAHAGVAIVVSSKSQAANLTTDQASQLFLGKTTSLAGAGEAQLINQAEGSAIRDTFYTKVTGKNAAQVKAIWARLLFSGSATPPKDAANAAEVKKLLGANDKAVGYLDTSDVDSSVKVLLTVD